MIVEEYSLYQQLPPKMQTELIQKIFSKFMSRFSYFFNSCEIGFRNEFIIWMYARKYLPNSTIQPIGKEADEIVFVMDGMVDLFTNTDKKFMQLPANSIFNDYQLIFNLKSNISFRSYSPIYESEAQYRNNVNYTQTMNLDGEKFQDLLELYEDTAENLKLRALEKRSIFMYYKNKVIKRSQRRLKEMKQKPGGEKLHVLKGADEDETRNESRSPELYMSTYSLGRGMGKYGEDLDSDQDPYHITMPFRHSDELRRKIFDQPEFESDEEREQEAEEKDKENARLIECQNKILDTMQKTLVRMQSELQSKGRMGKSMASELKEELLKVHEEMPGLKEDYEYVEDLEAEEEES